MQAKTFFAILGEGIKNKNIDHEVFMLELIDIAQVAQANKEWINELKEFHKSRYKRLAGVKEDEASKFRTPDELKLAAKIMMEGMRRLEGAGVHV